MLAATVAVRGARTVALSSSRAWPISCVQASQRVILTEEYLASQAFEEMGPLQPVHHWPLDFGQMESDARVLQAMIDLLKAFERRGIDYVHGRAHEHDMFELRPLGDKRGDTCLTSAPMGQFRLIADGRVSGSS